jgi:hypothetical protein
VGATERAHNIGHLRQGVKKIEKESAKFWEAWKKRDGGTGNEEAEDIPQRRSNVVTLSSFVFFSSVPRLITFVGTSNACVTHSCACTSVARWLIGYYLPHPMSSRHTGPLMNTVDINVSPWSVPVACIVPHTDAHPHTRTLSHTRAFGSLGHRLSPAIQPNTPECTYADDERG